MKLTLLDQGGEKLKTSSAASIKKVLMNPVNATLESKHNDYAMVYCEEAETFILRLGYGKKYNLTVIFWDNSNEDATTIEEHFEATDRDKAIKRFLKLCRRNPVYENVSA